MRVNEMGKPAKMPTIIATIIHRPIICWLMSATFRSWPHGST
jgi:hypothetical protein